jgi:hypothetical protein
MKTYAFIFVCLYFVPALAPLITPVGLPVLVAEAEFGSPPTQYGALGLLGFSLWYFGTIWREVHRDNKQTIERIVTEKAAALREVTSEFRAEIIRRDERYDKELVRRDTVINDISTAVKTLIEDLKRQKAE